MIKPILCGTQQGNLFNKRQKHVVVRSVEKSTVSSIDSNQKSLTKEKRSLKFITNKQNKTRVRSQFGKQAEGTDIQWISHDEKIFQPNHLKSFNQQAQKYKYPSNSFFSIKQNRRKFQTIFYHPPQIVKNSKNTQSQQILLQYQSFHPSASLYSTSKVNKYPQHALQANNQSLYYKRRKLRKVQSLYISRQNSTDSKASLLNTYFPQENSKNKRSLRPHSSVENFNVKSTSSKALKDSKTFELGKRYEKKGTFFKTWVNFQPNRSTQICQNIYTQRAPISQKNPEKSKFFLNTLKNDSHISQYQRQRTSLGSNINKNEKEKENQEKLDLLNSHQMSKFFSLKTSRFFIPTERHDKNLESEVVKGSIEVHDNNVGKIHQKWTVNDKKQILTDSTRASGFFDSTNWKKRQVQSRFSINESIIRPKFGLITQISKQSNIFNPKLKTQLSEGKFLQIPLKFEKAQEKFNGVEKIEQSQRSSKRKTINHQSSIQNFPFNHNSSLKNSFFFNAGIRKIQSDDDKSKVSQCDRSAITTRITKYERSQKQKPSFFADLQRRKQQQQALKKNQQKAILQKDEQENHQANQGNLFQTVEMKDAQSVADNNSQKDSELEFVLHSTDKIHLKSFAQLKTWQQDKNNFIKFKS